MGQYIIHNGELYHHGVKGMKWGVKKSKGKSSGKKISFKAHEDYKKAHKRKSIRKMSDKELTDRNKRLGAEQKYKELKKKSRKDIGKFAVDIILKTTGTAVVTAGAVYAGKKYLPQLLSGDTKVAGILMNLNLKK